MLRTSIRSKRGSHSAVRGADFARFAVFGIAAVHVQASVPATVSPVVSNVIPIVSPAPIAPIPPANNGGGGQNSITFGQQNQQIQQLGAPSATQNKQPRVILDFPPELKKQHNSFQGFFGGLATSYSRVRVRFEQYTAHKVTQNVIREVLAESKFNAVTPEISFGYSHMFSNNLYLAGLLGVEYVVYSSKAPLELRSYGANATSTSSPSTPVYAAAVYGGMGISFTARIGFVFLPRLVGYVLLGVATNKLTVTKNKVNTTQSIATTTPGAASGNPSTTVTTTMKINPTSDDPSWTYPALRLGLGAEIRPFKKFSLALEAAFTCASGNASVSKLLSDESQAAHETSVTHRNAGVIVNLRAIINI